MNFKKFILISAVSMLAFNVFSADGYMEIDSLESKKREYVSVKNGNPAEEREILENAKKEYEAAAKRIDQELVRIAETDSNGNMLADVKKRRAEEKLVIKAEIDKRAQAEIQALKNGDTTYENQLKAEIQQMEKDLRVTRVIDSFEYPELLQVKSYAGDKFYWNTTSKFSIGSNVIFNQNIPLYYDKVSGKSPAQITKSNETTYNDYLDTVDYYDDCLRYNDGTIVLEVEYVISACDIDMPSTYTVQIKGMRFVNKVENKVIQKITPTTSTYTLKITPAVDLRYVNNMSSYSNNKTLTGSVEAANAGTGNKTISAIPDANVTTSSVPTKTQLLYNNTTANERFLVGCSFGTLPVYNTYDLQEQFITCNAFFTYPIIPHLFVQMDMGIMPTPSVFGDYKNSSELVFDTMFGAGFNISPNFGGYRPNLYVSGAIGLGTSSNLRQMGYSDYEPVLFLSRVSAGVDFPIGNLLVLTTDWSMWFVESAGIAFNYSLGFSIDLN